MFRLAYLLAATRVLFWNAGTVPSTGEWMVWAGTQVVFECGPHAALSWDDEGLAWCVCFTDRQDEWDDFYCWGWYAEGRLDGETTIVTP